MAWVAGDTMRASCQTAHMADPEARGRVAAIDIGSNSIHLVVVSPGRPGEFSVVAKEKYMVKLGAGTFQTRELSEESVAAGLEAAEAIARILEGAGVEEVAAVATSAVREAKNGKRFTSSFEERVGVRPAIISGREEARLIARAVQAALPLGDEQPLVIDIGGGSTELAVVGRQGPCELVLPLGVQRLLGEAEGPGPLSADARKAVESGIDRRIAEPIRKAMSAGTTTAVGTSGTIKALGELVRVARGEPSWPTPTGAFVSVEELRAVADKLCEADEGERRSMGVDDRRADAIHLGALVVLRCLTRLAATGITLCGDALREGLILDRLAPAPAADHAEHDVGERAVRALMTRARCDGARADHIADLASQLFRETRALHHLGDGENRILCAAARLHAAGQWLAYRRYHKHTRYLIWYADLRGFSPRERLLMGHVARYHRKKGPKPTHKKLSRVDDEGQRIVKILAGVLRVAVALDRCRSQAVEGVTVHDDGDVLRFGVAASRDAELEIEAARIMSDTLGSALDRSIEVDLESS